MATEIRAVDALRGEIKSVDSKINLLAEKIKRLETQNVTIANSLFKITERLKKIEESGGTGAGGSSGAKLDSEQSQDIQTFKESTGKALKEYEAVKNDVYNIKYTLGLINPLEFVTARQVNELVDERLEQKLEQMRTKKASSAGKKKENEED